MPTPAAAPGDPAPGPLGTASRGRVDRGTHAGAPGVPLLGVDVGSTNVKAVLVHVDVGTGSVVEVAVRSARTPGQPDELVRVVCDLVASVLDGRPAPLSVGVASMAETGAVLGPDGEPLTELLRWDGLRGARDTEQLAADLGREALFAATGVRAAAKVPLVTWAWLRRTRPGVWVPGARWAGAADLVCLSLTGRLVTDHTLAGRTMAYRLPPVGAPLPTRFDADLLSAVGLTPDRLPAVVRPGEVAGTVTSTAWVRAGLTPGTPVVVAGHDHAVGCWAAGARSPGDAADSIGTAEAVLTVLGPDASRRVDRLAVASQGMSVVRTVEGTHEALLAGSPAAGAMVQWWLATVLPGRSLDGVLRAVTRDGAERPGPTGVLVLPYPHGRQAPDPDPGARVRVVDADGHDVTAQALAVVPGTGVPPRSARDVRAVLEGLALHARWLLDAQRRHAGRPVPPTAAGDVLPLHVLAGPAGTNATWMGAKAALTRGPLRAVTAAEPVGTGAAVLAAERAGLVVPGAVRLPARVVLPGPGSGPAWQDALRRFIAAAT